jgi:hypothetical protein
MIAGIEFEVEGIFKNKRVEVRYNPFDLSCVHIYYAGRFVQKATPAKLSRWNTAAKVNAQKPESPQVNTGIKPLAQLEQQHQARKRQQAKELVGHSAKRNDQALTLPEFIHLIATSLGKKPEGFHAREVEALQDFWRTYQPLSAECVGIAVAKAALRHGLTQHLEVYLQAIKTLHLKSRKDSKS